MRIANPEDLVGGGGPTAVARDDTLAGDGTAANPLGVAAGVFVPAAAVGAAGGVAALNAAGRVPPEQGDDSALRAHAAALASASAPGHMSAADKTKLDGLSDGGGGGGGGFNARLVRTASGTFTAPVAGWYRVTCIGGGGGGGGFNGGLYFGGGGGGAGNVVTAYARLAAGQALACTIGAGGTGGTASAVGTAGGATSFSSIASAAGGSPGLTAGNPGASAVGAGLNGTYGAGSLGRIGGGGGSNGTAYGAGGGGAGGTAVTLGGNAAAGAGTTTTGGKGGAGAVILEYHDPALDA